MDSTNPKPKPRREALASALRSRRMTLAVGRCRRKDIGALRASISRTEAFLRAFPYATDDRVRDWCRAHWEDVVRIVPGNNRRTLIALLGQDFEYR